MSEIQAASVHFGWDEGRIENEQSFKIILNNKKNLEKKSSFENADLWWWVHCMITRKKNFF